MAVVYPLVRFGLFELDRDTGELTKNGRKLKLQEQPFRLLRLLIENSGRPVSRDQLKEALWPSDTFVDFDHSLNAAVAKLRQTLGDSAESPRFIETVARRGYRFIAPVETAGPAVNASPVAVAKRIRPRVALLAICSLAAVVLVIFAVILWPKKQAIETELSKLTDDSGFTTDPVVSSDGKLLAYSSDRGPGGNLHIWIQQMDSAGTAVQLTHGDSDAIEPAFSPDNNRIAFSANRKEGGVFLVPVIGGEATRLAETGRSPHFSPDGRWIAYCSDGTDTPVPSGLEGGHIFIIPAGGGEPRRLAADLPSAANPVWTSDGRHLLVYVPPERGLRWDQADWWWVPLDGTPSKKTGLFDGLKRQGFSLGLGRIPRLSQSSGQFLVFAAGRGDAIHSWRMPITPGGHITGPAERLTSATTLEVSPALSAKGELVFASLTATTAVWSVQADPDHAKIKGEFDKTTDGPAELLPSLSTDGRMLAFTAPRRRTSFSPEALAFADLGDADLQARVRDLSNGREVLVSHSEATQWHPQISRDGSVVAYVTGKPGTLYAARARGGAAKAVFSGGSMLAWDWSNDNKTLLFNAPDQQVQSLAIASGIARPFLTRPGFQLFQAKFSPGDQAVAVVSCVANTVTSDEGCRIYVVPVASGSPAPLTNWIALDHPSHWDDKPRWSPDGGLLYFVSDRDGYNCLWGQKMDIRSKRPIGNPFSVYHFHKARLSMANLGVPFTEIGIARDKIIIGLEELHGNIWGIRRKQ